jgi:hypothetical protein
MKMHLKINTEFHIKLVEGLERNKKVMEKAMSGIKGMAIRKFTGGAYPLAINYTVLSAGEFEITTGSVLGDAGFFRATRRWIEREIGKENIIEVSKMEKG